MQFPSMRLYVHCSSLFPLCSRFCFSRFSVYSGHHTILIPPGDLETNPALWLSVVSQYKGNICVFHSRGYRCEPRPFQLFDAILDWHGLVVMWVVVRSQTISGLRRRLGKMVSTSCDVCKYCCSLECYLFRPLNEFGAHFLISDFF